MRASVGDSAVLIGLVLSSASVASAQYPPPAPQQPPQPQPYPSLPTPAQQDPNAPPQPYPQPPAPYGQGAPPGYGQQPAPLPGPYYQTPVMQPQAPKPRDRSPGELAYLYGVATAYGIGTGVWVDALGKIGDPGLAVLAPLILGAAAPVGVYVWDQARIFDRGVPSSIATGLLLGAVEGVAIGGLQWQLTGHDGPNTWDFRTQTSVTFTAATVGGVGGYLFGQWAQPDPHSLALIASGSGWGAVTGILFGAGVVSGNQDWEDGQAVWGFAGYNLGLFAAGAVSTFYVPSFQTLKYMWAGQVLGALATTPVYLFYIGDGANARHGLIANAVGGLAGLTVAALLTGNMSDSPGASAFTAPFQLAVGPASSPSGNPNARGGAQLTMYGQF